MLWLAKFDADEVRSLLPRATVMMGVPTFYTRLLALPSFGPADCRTVRLFVSGSAPLLAETFGEFRERTGQTILERYGMTETGMITSNPLDGERIAGTVGPALPGVSARVVDAEGRHALPATSAAWRSTVRTCSQATGACRTRRARNSPRTVISERATWASCCRTATWHRRPGEGSHHHRRPQRLSQGNRGEDRRAPGVVESAIIGIPDADFGEAVAAVVVAQPGCTLTETGLIGALRDEIARFKVPKHVQFVTELPRNAMGKVQKNLLRERFAKP
jgi:malonyl-CoA/methylmalonyl-CoA synthetase